MADYVFLALFVFIINVIPAFMPPTWFLLALARINDPSFDPLLLTIVGAVSSTAGRIVLTYYSSFFRRFFTKHMRVHAEDIRAFFDRRGRELFIGTLVYSLSPLPSNLVFIANGLTKVNYKPVFAGFFLGRLVSYFALIVLSQNLFSIVGGYTRNEYATYIFEALGIAAAFSVVLIDWKKLVKGAKKSEKPGNKKSSR
jgi:uncharacterized membrane protein YdjX (TVP38/TMEM64 family)